MRRILATILSLLVMTVMASSLGTTASAAALPDHPYFDFSSDRSTWFFRTAGGRNDVAFCDFFFPFNPTVKTRTYDPLAMYKLDHAYYFDSNGILMINIDDLKKLYDPYFDYEISDDALNIRHTLYNKLITSGFRYGRLSTEYTKMVWDLSIDISDGSAMNTGTYDYTEYEPTSDGNASNINPVNSTTGTSFTFTEGTVESSNGEWYVPLAPVMELMGKISIAEEGYLTIQGANMPDVTMEVIDDPRREGIVDEIGQPVVIPEPLIPNPGNFWRCGAAEECDPDYTWADYMDDVSNGQRETGWLWRAFHIPTGSSSKDANGEAVTLEDPDRILPFSMYVPSRYHRKKTRLVVMLHGASSNENTTCDRLADRDINGDQYAEEYNYIVVSPNGWTREPEWREGQALYSFEKSFEMAMDEFPVKESRVFITGNSYGGKGTLELAMRFPDRFRAMAPTAPKIGERGDYIETITIPGDPDAEDPNLQDDLRIKVYEEYINFEETGFGLNDIWAYDLSDIADMPTMLVQGTGDTTTSYYFQIGNQLREGPIVMGVIPKLTNAIYLVVEKGFHSYAYGTALKPIFDFFENQLRRCKKPMNTETLYIYRTQGAATLARFGEEGRESCKKSHHGCRNNHRTRVVSTELVDDTLMIALSDLEKIYGKAFKAYSLSAYAIDPAATVHYWTLIHNNQTLNFRIGETKYRRNMERYKMDVLSIARTQDQRLLDPAPEFSVAPYEKDGEIFVPVVDVMDGLWESVEIVDSCYAGRRHDKRNHR